MDWTAVIIVMVLILVLGSAITIFWWNLVAKVSPYQDEVARQKDRKHRGSRQEQGEVVVIKSDVAKAPADGHGGGKK